MTWLVVGTSAAAVVLPHRMGDLACIRKQLKLSFSEIAAYSNDAPPCLKLRYTS
jgi:hypothetical protein